MANLPQNFIDNYKEDDTRYDIVGRYIASNYDASGEVTAVKDWSDIEALVSGGFQFIVSSTALDTPDGVTWIDALGNTVTGTLLASDAESPAMYFVPIDLTQSNDHIAYTAIGSPATWEIVGNGGSSDVFWATPSVTSLSDITTFSNAGKIVLCKDAGLIYTLQNISQNSATFIAIKDEDSGSSYTVTSSGWDSPSEFKFQKTYVYNQMTAAAVWNINHNLGRYPSVSVVDSAGSVAVGETVYVDANNITITFQSQFSGTAYLN